MLRIAVFVLVSGFSSVSYGFEYGDSVGSCVNKKVDLSGINDKWSKELTVEQFAMGNARQYERLNSGSSGDARVVIYKSLINDEGKVILEHMGGLLNNNSVEEMVEYGYMWENGDVVCAIRTTSPGGGQQVIYLGGLDGEYARITDVEIRYEKDKGYLSVKEIKEEFSEMLDMYYDVSDYYVFNKVDLEKVREAREKADELLVEVDGLKEGDKVTLHDFAKGAQDKLVSKYKGQRVKLINASLSDYRTAYTYGFSVVYDLEEKYMENKDRADVYIQYSEKGNTYVLNFMFDVADGLARLGHVSLRENGLFGDPLSDKEGKRLWKEYSGLARKAALSNQSSLSPDNSGSSSRVVSDKLDVKSDRKVSKQGNAKIKEGSVDKGKPASSSASAKSLSQSSDVKRIFLGNPKLKDINSDDAVSGGRDDLLNFINGIYFWLYLNYAECNNSITTFTDPSIYGLAVCGVVLGGDSGGYIDSDYNGVVIGVTVDAKKRVKNYDEDMALKFYFTRDDDGKLAFDKGFPEEESLKVTDRMFSGEKAYREVINFCNDIMSIGTYGSNR